MCTACSLHSITAGKDKASFIDVCAFADTNLFCTDVVLYTGSWIKSVVYKLRRTEITQW